MHHSVLVWVEVKAFSNRVAHPSTWLTGLQHSFVIPRNEISRVTPDKIVGYRKLSLPFWIATYCWPCVSTLSLRRCSQSSIYICSCQLFCHCCVPELKRCIWKQSLGHIHPEVQQPAMSCEIFPAGCFILANTRGWHRNDLNKYAVHWCAYWWTFFRQSSTR